MTLLTFLLNQIQLFPLKWPYTCRWYVLTIHIKAVIFHAEQQTFFFWKKNNENMFGHATDLHLYTLCNMIKMYDINAPVVIITYWSRKLIRTIHTTKTLEHCSSGVHCLLGQSIAYKLKRLISKKKFTTQGFQLIDFRRLYHLPQNIFSELRWNKVMYQLR